MKLLEVLSANKREMISLIGAGGKTTTMYALARSLREQEKTVAVSTTTFIFYPEKNQVNRFFIEGDQEKLQRILSQQRHSNEIIGFGKHIVPLGYKVKGIDGKEMDQIYMAKYFDYMIVEADGAKRKPLKAPAAYEPVIPTLSTIVLVVIGIDACGALLNEENVHRSHIVSRITQIPVGNVLTSDAIATLVTDPDGCMKGIPLGTRIFLLINKVNGQESYRWAKQIACKVRKKDKGSIEKILLCDMLGEEQVLAIY
ncbi:selenium cofactor biosynthesis protein YqeC [Clostridiaceae bacterium 35-E11]